MDYDGYHLPRICHCSLSKIIILVPGDLFCVVVDAVAVIDCRFNEIFHGIRKE